MLISKVSRDESGKIGPEFPDTKATVQHIYSKQWLNEAQARAEQEKCTTGGRPGLAKRHSLTVVYSLRAGSRRPCRFQLIDGVQAVAC